MSYADDDPVKKMLDWLDSPEGQELIRKTMEQREAQDALEKLKPKRTACTCSCPIHGKRIGPLRY